MLLLAHRLGLLPGFVCTAFSCQLSRSLFCLSLGQRVLDLTFSFNPLGCSGGPCCLFGLLSLLPAQTEHFGFSAASLALRSASAFRWAFFASRSSLGRSIA
ncbi:hypothetical protein GTA26_28225 [Rhodococcus hoagii]|nr:hypothetical protein [Prescottella equi]